MLDFKPTERLMEMDHTLQELFDQVLANIRQYQRFVGKLICLSHTRPDITYHMSMVSQFMHAISEEHVKVVFRILRYLKTILGKGFLFAKDNNPDIKDIEMQIRSKIELTRNLLLDTSHL